MPDTTLRLGLCQMTCVTGDVEANLDIVADTMGRAQHEGIQLLVFPELAISGYAIGSRFSEASLRPQSPHLQRLCDFSRQVPMVVGLIEETDEHEFYNSAMYLEAGKVRHVHRKIYLPTYRKFDERRYFGAGREVRAFDTPWTRMAILICGDCWHLTLPYLAAHDGANLLLVVAASSTQGLSPTTSCRDAWARMNQSYALSLSTFVAFANHVGDEGDLHFWGGSHVVRPDGNMLVQAPQDEPHLLVADLDFKLLREQRLILPFRRDDNLGLTVELGQRILRSKSRRHKLGPPGPGASQDTPR